MCRECEVSDAQLDARQDAMEEAERFRMSEWDVVIGKLLEREPEATSGQVSQYVVDELFYDNPPDAEELPHLFQSIATYAKEVWACPSSG